MCITGALGIPGSGRERTNTRNSFVSKTLLCLALLLPNGLNMMLTIPFNLKLPGGILYYSFLFINIFFFQAGVFMGFSITSAVFGGIIILFYSIGISQITSSDPKFYFDDVESYNEYYQGKVAILAIMLMMGIATFGIGIWAAICTCLLKPCCEQQPQVE